MAKTLTITDPTSGKTYTLEYTRKTVAQLEKQGFVAEEVSRKPVSMLPILFAGAFLAHHKFVKQDVIDGIYAKLTDKEGLIGKLIEMYNDPVIALMAEPEEGETEGNMTWTADW